MRRKSIFRHWRIVDWRTRPNWMKREHERLMALVLERI
jgi:hypothetical protein